MPSILKSVLTKAQRGIDNPPNPGCFLNPGAQIQRWQLATVPRMVFPLQGKGDTECPFVPQFTCMNPLQPHSTPRGRRRLLLLLPYLLLGR